MQLSRKPAAASPAKPSQGTPATAGIARPTETGVAKPARGMRHGKAVGRLVATAKTTGFFKRQNAIVSGTIAGAGLALIPATPLLGAATLAVAGASAVSFKKLGEHQQKTLLAAMLGRPRIAKAVCERINEPELEQNLKMLGNIYLPMPEMKNMRKYILEKERFDITYFLSGVRILHELGELRERFPRLTQRAVDDCLQLYGTKLEWPISKKTGRALAFAKNVIDLLQKEHLEYRTMASIVRQVYAFQKASILINNAARENAALHIGRRTATTLHNSFGSFKSNVFERQGYLTIVKTDNSGRNRHNRGVWNGRVILEFRKTAETVVPAQNETASHLSTSTPAKTPVRQRGRR